MESTPVEMYTIPKNNSGFPDDVRVLVQTGKKNKSDSPYDFYINAQNLSIFELEDYNLKKKLSNALSIQIYYKINAQLPEFVTTVDCYNYTIVQTYSLEQGSIVKLDLNINEDICSTDITGTWTNIMWINVCVCIMAVFSLLLSWKYVFDFYRMYINIKKQYKTHSYTPKEITRSLFTSIYKRNQMFLEFTRIRKESATETELEFDEITTKENNSQLPRWEKVTIQEKRALFNFWNVLAIISNTFQISGTMLYLFNKTENLSIINFLNGLGCMLAWVNITRYFEYSPTYFVVYSTLRVSLPLITKYLVAILPIFFGFALLGACLFSNSERFTSMGRSMFTLFALMNGDMVFDTFHDITDLWCICAQLFIYIFCLLFIWFTY